MDLPTSQDNKNTSTPVDKNNNSNNSLFQAKALLNGQSGSVVTNMPLMSQIQSGHHQTPPLYEQQLNLPPHLYSQGNQAGLSHISMVQSEQSSNTTNIQLGQNTPTLIQTSSAVVHPGLVNINNQLSSPQLSDTSSSTGPILQMKSDDRETASPVVMMSHDNIFGITPQPNQSISLPLSQTNEQQNQEQSNQDHLLQSQEHLHLNQQQENHEQQHHHHHHHQQQQQQQQQQHMLHDMMKSSPSGIENHPMVPSHHSLDQQSTIHHQPFSSPNQMDEERERVAAVAQQVMAQQMAHQYAMIHQQQQQQQQQQQSSPQSNEQMALHNMPVQQMMVQSPPIIQQQDAQHVVLSQIASVGSSSSSSSPSSLLQESKPPRHISLQNAIAMVQQQPQTSPLSLISSASSQQPQSQHQSPQPQVTFIEKTNENNLTPQNNISNSNKRMNDVINSEDNMAHGMITNNSNKKSRRHTFSSSTPPSQFELHVDINDNNNNNNNNDSPHSAVVQTNGQFKFNLGGIGAAEPSLLNRRVVNEQQKQALCTIELPPPPTPAELGLQEVKQLRTAKDYEGMSREELISRLVLLENERLGFKKDSENVVSSTTSATSATAGATTTTTAYQLSVDTRFECSAKSDDEDDSPNTPTDMNKNDTKLNNPCSGDRGLGTHEEKSSSIVNDEDEDMEDTKESNIEQETNLQLVCKWKDCDLQFTKLQKLISHINDTHVGSGKPTYCCEWENCPRNQKPFTKRHKMYNHLRTHTGERPFVCTKPGCGKRFSRPDSLTTHIKTHSNVRPFICQAKGCGKAYYHSRSLKKHEKTHEITPMPPLSSATTTPSEAAIHYKSSYPVSVPALPLHHQHHHPNQMDYINSQLQQQQQQISIHSQSLPNSPHPSLSQQQNNNFGMIQQVKSYTPTGTVHSMPSFTQPPSGMVENQVSSTPHTEPVMSQLFDSANQTQQNDFVFRQAQ